MMFQVGTSCVKNTFPGRKDFLDVSRCFLGSGPSFNRYGHLWHQVTLEVVEGKGAVGRPLSHLNCDANRKLVP